MDDPVTVAVKVDVWPVSNETLPGETATLTVDVTGPAGLPPPQPAVSMAKSAGRITLLRYGKFGKRPFPLHSPAGRSLDWFRCLAAYPPLLGIGGFVFHV